MRARTPSRAVLLSLSAAAIILCTWVFFLGFRDQPLDRTVSNVALSKTGKWFAAGTSQGLITVWAKGRDTTPRRVSFPYGPLNDIQFSPDERLLVIASSDLGIYAPEESVPPRLLRSDKRNYGTVRFSSDGQTLLVITAKGTIETLDLQSGITRLTLCCSTIYGDVGFSPDGQTIVNAGHWPRIWDAHSGKLLGWLTKKREFHTFRPIAFDTAHDLVLMGSQDGRVYAWSLTTRQIFAMSHPHSEYVDTIAILAKGWIAYAGFDKVVRLWNPYTGQEHSLAMAHPTSNLIVGPEGNSVIFGTAQGEVEFWDVEAEGKRLRAIAIPER